MLMVTDVTKTKDLMHVLCAVCGCIFKKVRERQKKTNMFHFDLRNYQSAFGRSVLHLPTLDVFALLSVFQLLRTVGLTKCGNVVLGKDQREDGSYF